MKSYTELAVRRVGGFGKMVDYGRKILKELCQGFLSKVMGGEKLEDAAYRLIQA